MSKSKREQGKQDEPERTVVARNRRALHRFVILEKREAGIVLTGPEVKSLRGGTVNIADAYANIRDDTAWLLQMEIPPYAPAVHALHKPRRVRKLLLHRQEIKRLEGRLDEKGTTLIPLSIYFVHGLAKVELALARGAKEYDKRERDKAQEARREIKRGMEKAGGRGGRRGR